MTRLRQPERLVLDSLNARAEKQRRTATTLTITEVPRDSEVPVSVVLDDVVMLTIFPYMNEV